MVARIVDISVPLENGVPSDPPGYGFKISYVPHKETAHLWLSRYENLKSEDIGGEAFATEDIQLSTHNGTHVDAPWHYSSTMKNGMPTATIDEIPLEWFYGSGVKLDLKHLAHGTEATPRDIDDALFAANHTLKPNDIVLFNTAAGARYGFEDYTRSGCGFGRDATLHLTKQGIRVAGTDAWSWDPPFYAMQKKFLETHDANVIWSGHRAGREIPYCHIEKLHNLDQLPPTGFRVACFPVKIKGGSAGWTRAVAIFDEEPQSPSP